MALIRSYVDLMNGTIEVDSEKHKGTTFTVTVTLIDCDHKKTEEEERESLKKKKEERMREDAERSMQACLNAHLSKPVEPDELFETLEGLLHH